ncbi:MAG: 50S ribosomal protein L22 [Candidatus Micrarchaeota archaeon]
MGLYRFSFKVLDEKEVARAQAYDLDASYKDLTNVFAAIKGKTVPDAASLLEDCISMKRAVRYRKFNKGLGHRSELGGKKGRYPKKEAKIALVLLKSAQANANFKGLDMESLVVRQAAAYKQNRMRRYRHHFGSSITLGYGKQAIWADYMTCRGEIVLAKGRERDLKRKANASKKEAKAAVAKPAEKGK